MTSIRSQWLFNKDQTGQDLAREIWGTCRDTWGSMVSNLLKDDNEETKDSILHGLYTWPHVYKIIQSLTDYYTWLLYQTYRDRVYIGGNQL